MIYLPFRVVVIMTIASAGNDKIRENVSVADNRLRVSSELRSRKSNMMVTHSNCKIFHETSFSHHRGASLTVHHVIKAIELGKHLTVPILTGHRLETTASQHKT